MSRPPLLLSIGSIAQHQPQWTRQRGIDNGVRLMNQCDYGPAKQSEDVNPEDIGNNGRLTTLFTSCLSTYSPFRLSTSTPATLTITLDVASTTSPLPSRSFGAETDRGGASSALPVAGLGRPNQAFPPLLQPPRRCRHLAGDPGTQLHLRHCICVNLTERRTHL